MQLPAEADIVPVLGAHPWIKVLTRGDSRDRDRVSHVFAYDYRMNGEPDKRRSSPSLYPVCATSTHNFAIDNWLANYTNTEEGEDPPEHLRFPVKFPYPHVSWASPKGKSCARISLALPPSRQRTPIPDTVRLLCT